MNVRMLQKYNTEKTIIVISSYPRRGEIYSKGVCAVASFTKNTLLSLKKANPQAKLVVLTMTLGKKQAIYEEDDMLIVRCFERNNPVSYLSLISMLKRFSEAKQVLVEFEFSSFGDTLATLLFPVNLYAARLLGKHLTVVYHQVLTDLRLLSGHIGLKSTSLLSHILNLGIAVYYKILSLPIHTIVVLEEDLKKRLEKRIGRKPIVVIPHGVDTNIPAIPKMTARKQLGFSENELIILYFGYITWYKGTDILLQAMQKLPKVNGKTVRLVIAGGESFTQGNKKHYQIFLKKVYTLAEGMPHITITGFVPEEKIGAYFSASDMLVFPYRTFMSASGPFSLALSFGKPFLISERLTSLMENRDVEKIFSKHMIKATNASFLLTPKSLYMTLKRAVTAPMLTSLTNVAKELRQQRSFNEIAKQYESLLTPHTREAKMPLSTPLLSPLENPVQ